MKVVVTGTRGIPNVMGGIETHCEEMYPLIAQMGADVTVVRRSDYVRDQLTEWKGVHLIDIASPKKKALETIVHTFKAINRAKKEKADIVHLHAVGPALLSPYARLLGMKVVFTHHGPDYDRDKWNKFAKFVLRLGERVGCKYANQVVVISEVIEKMVSEKYNCREKVHLIHNGVSSSSKIDMPKYFEELGISAENYILAMCRFVPEKNLHHLVEAYAILKKNHPEWSLKLVLAGDTDFEDEYSLQLKKMARENGVVLTGFVRGEKLDALRTHASCFVLPSSHEGLPIALLEAMSYDLPVVVSDIPANLAVQLPEDNYFKVGDVKDLANHLQALLEKGTDQRHTYDLSQYQWPTIAEQLMEVYKKI